MSANESVSLCINTTTLDGSCYFESSVPFDLCLVWGVRPEMAVLFRLNLDSLLGSG